MVVSKVLFLSCNELILNNSTNSMLSEGRTIFIEI